VGGNTVAGTAEMPVPAGPAHEVTLRTTLVGTDVSNRWRLWTYPKVPAAAPGAQTVQVVGQLDDALLKSVEKGGRALLIADQLNYQVPAFFTNPVWTPQNNIETTGQLIREKHGALGDFPTASHSDFQWHNLLRPGRAFILNDLPQVAPVIQAIDSPSVMRNYRLGTVVAVRYGKGALVLTSYNLRDDLDKRPEARQLRQSLVNYLARGKFATDPLVTRDQLTTLLANPRFKAAAPGEKRLLEVDPSANADKDGLTAWTPESDAVVTRSDGFAYRFEKTDTRWGIAPPGDMVWRRGDARAWSLDRATLVVSCPKGFSGTIYVQFEDPENRGARNGYVYGLGGAFMPGILNSEKRWAALKVRPQDSANGEVRLHFRRIPYGDAWSTAALVTRLVVGE
jgi:hypothetical protein